MAQDTNVYFVSSLNNSTDVDGVIEIPLRNSSVRKFVTRVQDLNIPVDKSIWSDSKNCITFSEGDMVDQQKRTICYRNGFNEEDVAIYLPPTMCDIVRVEIETLAGSSTSVVSITTRENHGIVPTLLDVWPALPIIIGGPFEIPIGQKNLMLLSAKSFSFEVDDVLPDVKIEGKTIGERVGVLYFPPLVSDDDKKRALLLYAGHIVSCYSTPSHLLEFRMLVDTIVVSKGDLFHQLGVSVGIYRNNVFGNQVFRSNPETIFYNNPGVRLPGIQVREPGDIRDILHEQFNKLNLATAQEITISTQRYAAKLYIKAGLYTAKTLASMMERTINSSGFGGKCVVKWVIDDNVFEFKFPWAVTIEFHSTALRNVLGFGENRIFNGVIRLRSIPLGPQHYVGKFILNFSLTQSSHLNIQVENSPPNKVLQINVVDFEKICIVLNESRRWLPGTPLRIRIDGDIHHALVVGNNPTGDEFTCICNHIVMDIMKTSLSNGLDVVVSEWDVPKIYFHSTIGGMCKLRDAILPNHIGFPKSSFLLHHVMRSECLLPRPPKTLFLKSMSIGNIGNAYFIVPPHGNIVDNVFCKISISCNEIQYREQDSIVFGNIKQNSIRMILVDEFDIPYKAAQWSCTIKMTYIDA